MADPRHDTFSFEERRRWLEEAASGIFDLLVVGGGITGAGVAREAALRGLSVILLDRGDFASGTSSRSSKLIHGGIRYLAQGDIGLVREAARERSILRSIAPHLARPVRMLIPAASRAGRMKLAAGLWTFEKLAGDMTLLQAFVDGPWDDDRFLVVPPGGRIASSFDEKIVKAVVE